MATGRERRNDGRPGLRADLLVDARKDAQQRLVLLVEPLGEGRGDMRRAARGRRSLLAAVEVSNAGRRTTLWTWMPS